MRERERLAERETGPFLVPAAPPAARAPAARAPQGSSRSPWTAAVVGGRICCSAGS